jgi:uncharacterized protein (TIGR02147 family)
VQTEPNAIPAPSYRVVLKDALVAKARDQRGFSLRGFARKAGVSHALISFVLSGKKHLSRHSAIRVAEGLGLPEDRKESFLDLVEYETSRDERYREALLRRIAARDPVPANEGLVLTLEMFRMIADWYHFPVLELTELAGFDGKVRTAARLLGISELEARAAIDRLVALGLLEVREGRLAKTRGRVTTTSGVPSRSIREHHRQMIGRALEAIEGQGVERRYLTDMTVAIDRRDVAEVGRKLERFKAELSRFLNRRQRRDAVYQLNLQFFDLTKPFDPEEKSHVRNQT